ncbi:MAG: BlaI/MecI/CopY family transcriptional regulator [Gemmatimonadales bacterium]|nr:BlaI/MecI/CopY family transcriptional regulator [Gemmatimonadales bacterium]
MSGESPFLTELQHAVMRVLWDRGRATVAEVTEALRSDRGLAPTTIATILSRLEKRGVVGHDAAARQFHYFAILTEAEATQSMVAELTDRLFDGDVTALVSHLLTAKQISRGDLARVKALIAERERGKERPA